jgi:hypothetical protein
VISQNEFGEIWGNLGKKFWGIPKFGEIPKISEKKRYLPICVLIFVKTQGFMVFT